MNAIFFGFKRAYYGTLRLTRHALRQMGLTAARFDLLHILDHAHPGMPQRELQRALGVASSTVSRMLTSLELLGLVLREPMLGDLRRTWVELTKKGRRLVRRAAYLFLSTGQLQLAVDSALCPQRWYREDACKEAREACDQILTRVRDAYGDVATRDYPRVPDYVPPDHAREWAVAVSRSKR